MKKRHFSNQGKEIHFDELVAQSPHSIAIGNAKLNARGDKLGENGKIIQTAEDRATATQVTNAYNENPPKGIKMISIKDNVDIGPDPEKAKTPIEIIDSLVPTEPVVSNEKASKKINTRTKREIIDSEK